MDVTPRCGAAHVCSHPATFAQKAARVCGVNRFLFTSSACVYPGYLQKSTEVTPLKEEDAYPAEAEDGYGWEKLYMERVCRHYTEDFGLDTRVVRFHNILGPLGTWDGGREKAPAAMCRKIAMAKLSALGAGAALCWARALGEFGATITFAGNLPGRTQTMPLAVYVALESQPDGAIALSLLLMAVSVVVLVLLRRRLFPA